MIRLGIEMSSDHSYRLTTTYPSDHEQDQTNSRDIRPGLTRYQYALGDFVMLRDDNCTRRSFGLTGFNYTNVWQVKSYHSFDVHAQRYRPVIPGTPPDGVCLSKEWMLGRQPYHIIFLIQDVRALPAIIDGRISYMGHAIRMCDGAEVQLRSAMFRWDWTLVFRGRVDGVVRPYTESELYVPSWESQRRILVHGVDDELFD